MADKSMFEGISIFDAAANENTGIRDRALSVAQLGRGRVGVYGSALAGGMVTRGLAQMAGMKTQEEEKAETISSILQETKGLDRNDPKNLLILASKFNEAGMPEVAQRFYQKSRDLTKELREATQKDTELQIAQQGADAATSQAETYAYMSKTGRMSVEDQTMIALKQLDFEEFRYMDQSSIDVWKHKTSLDLSQQIADNNLELGKDQNVISAVNAGVNYYLSRLKPEEIAVSKMIAENAQRQTVVDAYYKAGSLLYQNAALKSQNEVNAYNQAMGGDLTNVLLPNGQSGVGQMVWDPETQTASFKLVSTGEAGGELTDILATGTASQIQDAMVAASGVTADEQRVVTNVRAEFDKTFKQVSQFGDTWRIPETGIFSDDARAAAGLPPLTEVPTLMEFARYMGTTQGSGGYRENYINEEQWEILNNAHGLSYSKLHDDMVDSDRFQEQVVSDERKNVIMQQYPDLITNVEMLSSQVDGFTMHGETYPPMSLANAIEVLNSLTFDVYQPGTLRATETRMSGDNIKIAIQQLMKTSSTNQAAVVPVVDNSAAAVPVVDNSAAVVPVVDNTTNTKQGVAPVIIEREEVIEKPLTDEGYEAMLGGLAIDTRRTEANKKGNGRTYYESPEFDTSTKEGREAKKKYDQWKFKNTKKYRLQGIELPSSKIKR